MASTTIFIDLKIISKWSEKTIYIDIRTELLYLKTIADVNQNDQEMKYMSFFKRNKKTTKKMRTSSSCPGNVCNAFFVFLTDHSFMVESLLQLTKKLLSADQATW